MSRRANPSFPTDFPTGRCVLAPASANAAPLALRPMLPDDAGFLGGAFAKIEPWSRYPFTADTLTSYLEAGEDAAPRYVIEHGSNIGNNVAGALGLRLNWLRGPYIQFLGVLPEHQKAGIGARLLSWISETSAESGARNLWVAASDFNTSALRFYERHGFTRVATLDGLIQDGRDEVLLRKRL